MNNYLKLLTITALLTIFSFSSCDKEDLKIFATMTAKIDGQAWTSSLRTTELLSEKFVITASSLGGELIVITTFGIAEGTYTLSLIPTVTEMSAVYKASTDATTEDTYAALEGEIVLTEVDTNEKTISGTFKFSALNLLTETIEITEGKFDDLKYTGD
ncbi:MAG: DUF6252 family protein [Bacteroidota bacterium]|nr:DUF6252 family protein [Bacteroidota bacterium]